jgi:hypothetical protein
MSNDHRPENAPTKSPRMTEDQQVNKRAETKHRHQHTTHTYFAAQKANEAAKFYSHFAKTQFSSSIVVPSATGAKPVPH